jgi:hypothetical protein
MQVHREHPVDAGGLEQVGDEARSDRLARPRLLVLARRSTRMTAVIRFADASFAALTMIRSSTRCCAIGVAAVWTMNMSAPRTESSKRKYGEPSANVVRSTGVSSTPRCPAILSASSGCELPATTASRFVGVNDTARPTAR